MRCYEGTDAKYDFGKCRKINLLFALPLMLGNICQQLYTMVDTMIVGQVAGVEALAALGSVDFLMWIVTGISTGITQGFSILISQHYGAGNGVALRKVIAHSYRLTAITAVLVFALSQLLASAALTRTAYPAKHHWNGRCFICELSFVEFHLRRHIICLPVSCGQLETVKHH